jgi:hypothetical protein
MTARLARLLGGFVLVLVLLPATVASAQADPLAPPPIVPAPAPPLSADTSPGVSSSTSSGPVNVTVSVPPPTPEQVAESAALGAPYAEVSGLGLFDQAGKLALDGIAHLGLWTQKPKSLITDEPHVQQLNQVMTQVARGVLLAAILWRGLVFLAGGVFGVDLERSSEMFLQLIVWALMASFSLRLLGTALDVIGAVGLDIGSADLPGAVNMADPPSTTGTALAALTDPVALAKTMMLLVLWAAFLIVAFWTLFKIWRVIALLAVLSAAAPFFWLLNGFGPLTRFADRARVEIVDK